MLKVRIRQITATADLPKSGDARADVETRQRSTVDTVGLLGRQRARPNQRHLATNDIDQLR